MSIASRIEAINDHLVDDYKVLRLAGADLTGVNKNIVNLKMSWKERLLYFMNNGLEVVWENWDKVSGTGTTLSLNNTEEAPMKLEYKGNTSQNGTPTPSSPVDIDVVKGDNTIEVVGKNLFNGTFELGGININNGTNDSASDRVRTKEYIPVQPNTEYTISGVKASRFVIFYNSNKGYLGYSLVDSQATSGTFTTIANTTYIRWYVIQTNTNTNEQLEKGNQATTYEAYKGASYPISLGVENLLNISSNLGRTTSNGITFVPVFNDDGTLKYISVNGTATATANMQLAGTQTLNGSYTLSSGIGINNNIYIQCLKTSDYTAALRTDLPYNTGTFSNVNVVTYLYVKNGTTANNIKIYPMIEKGLVEHQYNPYGKTSIELCKIGTYQDKIDKSTGKNLFDKSTTTANKRVNSNDGTIGDMPNISCSDYIYIGDMSSIYLSGNKTSQNSTSYQCAFYNSNKTYISGISTAMNNVPMENKKIDIPTNAKYMIINFVTADIDSVMLNEGTTALPYEPYGKVWYKYGAIGKVVLDGTETWVNLNYAYYSTVLNNLIKNIVTTDTSIYVIADLFKGESAYEAGTQGTSGIYTVNTQLYLRGYNSTYADVNALKTFLSSNNTTVYYVLATPTYTEITDSTLINQLEAIKKSLEGQTNISQVNDGLPFELDVTALGEM